MKIGNMIIDPEITGERNKLTAVKDRFQKERAIIEALRVVQNDVARNALCDELIERLDLQVSDDKTTAWKNAKEIKEKVADVLSKEVAATGKTPEVVKQEIAKYGFKELQEPDPDEKVLPDDFQPARKPRNRVPGIPPLDSNVFETADIAALSKFFETAVKNKESTAELVARLKKDHEEYDNLFSVKDDQLSANEVKVYTDASQKLTGKKMMTGKDLAEKRETSEQKAEAAKKTRKAKKSHKAKDND